MEKQHGHFFSYPQLTRAGALSIAWIAGFLPGLLIAEAEGPIPNLVTSRGDQRTGFQEASVDISRSAQH